ncbi:hypothetical protein [Amycolatopsis vancoresmycina]|uniref:Lipoprotein n=1 Tax=Amycolatopsis vancoresmycina DSM 44592 TaxID=1292037 RepID=R1IBY5_9PSEU|nr:hypothetical protein [Amycolatopsis vancoresmycina]EOD67904.1 hypothetical protein H480_13987 [Amycolatopsis vancoresmycina DSM 44592]
MKIRLGCLLLLALTSACTPTTTGYGTIVADPTHAIPTPTTTAPPAPRDVPTETHTGKGSGEFQTSWPPDQLGFFTFDCPKCRDNVIIDTDGGEHGLVNAIGAYQGTTWMNTDPDRPTKRVTVHADAAWTATIADYRSIATAETGKPSSGKGDAVLKLPAGVTRIQFTARTKGNIAIWWMSPDDRDLILNQIGDVQVERDVTGPAYVMVEGYEATWTLTPG